MSNQASLYQKKGIPVEKLKLPTTLRPVPVAEFIDKVGERRVIQVGHNRRLRLKNTEDSLPNLLARASSKILGANIRKYRRAKGIGATEFGRKIGYMGDLKQQTYLLEKALRWHGLKSGTLLAVALVLDIPVSKLIPTAKEVLENTEAALEWNNQKLGETRAAILNEWRERYDLPPIAERFIYRPTFSDNGNEVDVL